MISPSPPVYPAEYYYPEFIDSRQDDPRISPPPPSLLSTAINIEQPKNKPKRNLAIDVVTNQGLPDADITAASRTNPKKNLIRDPAEKNIPRLIVDENIIKKTVRTPTYPVANPYDQEYFESNQIPNEYTNGELPHIRKQQQHQVVRYIGDEQPIDNYWKKEVLINDQGVVGIEPVKYDRSLYQGPFGLTRRGSLIFYISFAIITILAAACLIMTGVFYAQGYPSSSSSTAELAGIGVCGFVFYFGLLLILIGLWHQRHRQENLTKKETSARNESTEHLKTSMEHNEQYDYSYQQPLDYTPYEYYSNPPYASNVNEQMLLQQPGAATGAAHYDPVLWPSNIQIETQPDSKFNQPMELSLGAQQSRTIVTSPATIHTSIYNVPHNKIEKRSKHKPMKPIEVEPPKVEFDNINLNSDVIEQPLPILSKAPETTDMIKTIAQMEHNPTQTPSMSDISPRKHNRIQPIDNKTDISSSVNYYDKNDDDDHNHHHRHRHHRSHHRHHHHRSPHHHHGHHHHRHHRQQSPCSQCTNDSHHHHHQHQTFPHHYHHALPHHTVPHHHHHSVNLPRIITPQLPRIITPTPQKLNITTFRDTGINTGHETKIMRDSSVTADLEDIPNYEEDPLEKIPIVRRTIIVEPYPAQPTSQIIVKPRGDMIGKIRLGKTTQLNGENETIIYPSSAFMRKKTKRPKKKKKSTIINNNIIEDLHLEDVNDDDSSISLKKMNLSTRKTIKNAFYN